MNNLTKIFTIQFCILFFGNQILTCEPPYTYEQNDLLRILAGSKHVQGANLNFAPLWNRNFKKIDLSGTFLNGANFTKSNLKHSKLVSVSARSASFRWSKLKNADLSYSDFAGAHFFGANLDEITAHNANFKYATGLTNEIKAILRKQAQNVPENLTDEEFEEERKRVERQLRCLFGEALDVIFGPVFLGIDIILDYTLGPAIKGADKLADYLSSCFKKKEEEEKERIE